MYDNYQPGQFLENIPWEQSKKEDFHFPDEQPVKPSGSTPSSYTLSIDDEIPRLKIKRPEQIIRHEGYTVSYNSTYKIANWVAYELTPEEAKSKKEERSNKFVPNPDVKGATALNEDYTRTGYDRGHLAPAGDMKWSAKAMRESFYFSNICPQASGLNRGIWKTLEEQCRVWAINNGPLLIVTGPVITDDMRVMGKNRVGVPPSFYKVICFSSNDGIHGIGFLFENCEYKNVSLKSMAIPVDSVEKVTGIDFFYSLPDDIERRMESQVEWTYWTF
ncbi:MAG: DNA/RNA non-specific endonuclease [Tannerellaceae bacterium]|nr:DNA/RNA non-specific endonuclease [Tannerellaceae bacterium]